MVSITKGQTVEFIANASTPSFLDKADVSVARIYLKSFQDEGYYIEQVAESLSEQAAGGAKVNNQSTLVYRQKVQIDTQYELCFSWDLPEYAEKLEARAGAYQYGYRVYGEGYKFQQHQLTNA